MNVYTRITARWIASNSSRYKEHIERALSAAGEEVIARELYGMVFDAKGDFFELSPSEADASGIYRELLVNAYSAVDFADAVNEAVRIAGGKDLEWKLQPLPPGENRITSLIKASDALCEYGKSGKDGNFDEFLSLALDARDKKKREAACTYCAVKWLYFNIGRYAKLKPCEIPDAAKADIVKGIPEGLKGAYRELFLASLDEADMEEAVKACFKYMKKRPGKANQQEKS